MLHLIHVAGRVQVTSMIFHRVLSGNTSHCLHFQHVQPFRVAQLRVKGSPVLGLGMLTAFLTVTYSDPFLQQL